MKTLIITIILLLITIDLNAKRTDIYQHAKDMRLNSHSFQNRKAIPYKLFLIRRDAQRGNSQAQFRLAIIYASGNGVVKNERIAFRWFHKAALNNHTEAKYYMGLSFLLGKGVKRQPHLARQWFKRASRDGHKKATYHLTKIEKALFG